MMRDTCAVALSGYLATLRRPLPCRLSKSPAAQCCSPVDNAGASRPPSPGYPAAFENAKFVDSVRWLSCVDSRCGLCKGDTLKFGVFYDFRNPPQDGWHRPWREFYDATSSTCKRSSVLVSTRSASRSTTPIPTDTTSEDRLV